MLLNIGKITGTHHLKGALKVSSVFKEVDVLVGNKVIVENSLGGKKIYTVKDARALNAKKYIIEFEEITSKTQTNEVMNGVLYIRRDILGDASSDEYYVSDVIGMEVLDEVTSKNYGKIMDVFSTPAHDIFIVNEGKNEIMIPDVEEFVKNIDFENKIVKVELIEGMLNED